MLSRLRRHNSSKTRQHSNLFHKSIKERGKGKNTSRGVWAPVLIRGGSSFVIYDKPTTDMLLYEWLEREDVDSIKFQRNFIGDIYRLRECSTDDTDTTDGTIKSSGDEDSIVQLSIKQRAKALPRGPGAFGGNHVLINRERVKRSIQPLCREKQLDELAAKHAKKLAVLEKMEHSSLKKTMRGILENGPARLIGENVSRGKTALDIHDKMMLKHPQERNNILDRRFTSFGVGSAKSASGVLYIVQMFKG